MLNFTTLTLVIIIGIVIVLAPEPVKALGIAALLLVGLLYGTEKILKGGRHG